jgi:predicted Fe-Mo cluster-binding NifX family protein
MINLIVKESYLMKLCFPVLENNDMDSQVYNHFGSAPLFVIVDTASDSVSPLVNNDLHHAHGACNPIMALNGKQVDAIVVGGIGAGALMKLNQLGIEVFKAQKATIRENIVLLNANSLPRFTPQHTCGGHGPGSGCSH